MASKWRFAPFIPASSSRRASRGRRTTPSATRRCDSAPTLRALERFGRLTFPLGQTDRLHDGVAVRALALPEVGLRFLASHMVSLRGSVAVSTSAPRTPPRDLLPLLAGLRESDGNRLLATLHFAAFPALAAPQGAALPSTHRSLDVLARAFAVSPSARFLRRHVNTPLLGLPGAHRVPSLVGSGERVSTASRKIPEGPRSHGASDGNSLPGKTVTLLDRDMSTPPLNRAFDLSPALWQDRHGKRIAGDHLMRWSELPPNEGRD